MKSRILHITFLSFILILNGCSDEYAPKEISAGVSNYLSLMPQHTNMIFYANCEKIRNTPFGEKLRTEWENKARVEWEDEEYLDFKEKSGLDFEKDIYEIWGGVLPKSGNDEENIAGVIARGSFNQKRIINYLKNERPHKIDEESYKDITIFSSTGRNKDDFSFAFLNSEIILIGGDRWLKTVIQQSQNGSMNVLSNPTMAKFIHDIPYKDHLWAVLDVNNLTEEWADEIRKHGSGFQGTKSIENLQSLIFYTEIDEKSTIFVKGNFTTKEEAQLVEESLIGFKAIAKLMVSDDREAIDMLNDIKISTQGSELNISTKVDKKFWEKLEQKQKIFKGKGVELL